MLEPLLADLAELSVLAWLSMMAAVAIVAFFAGACVMFSDDNEEGCYGCEVD